MDLGLKDKVAVVTGGSKGIGEGIVRSLLGEGAKIANVNRSTAEGEALQNEYEMLGQECFFIQGDLCDIEACRAAVEKTIDRFGRIDILINNAGVNDGVGIDAGPGAFVGSLEKNLIHYYALVYYALDELKKSQGVIINIGSKVSVTGQGGTSGYAASKGAINGLTREWALDLAEFGIRVNAVLPAETWTPLYSQIIDTMPDPTAAKRDIENLIPLGRRFTTKEELADMVVFLASPRSSHTTGQIIFVDGGYTHFDRKYTAG
ncbi:MAG: SDR family oxidoreductase [Planctomycetes bacterium]|nr:SDR family oxidoreductase [Planctomycetota bacterium]